MVHLQYEFRYTGLRYGPHPNSAPDCIAVDQNDELVAIEVTEFVCKNAVEQNQKGNNVYRDWQPVEVITEVHKIIFKKDQVNFVGDPYSKKILVIHTDELILEPEAYTMTLSEAAFETKKIDEVYFLFSYSPHVKSYPYLRLMVSSKNERE